MEKFLIVVLFLCVAISCRKDKNIDPIDQKQEENNGNNEEKILLEFPERVSIKDSVGIIDAKDLNIETYHTKIDTIYNHRYLRLSLKALSSASDSTVFKWLVNTKEHSADSTTVRWQQDPKYWSYESYISVDLLNQGLRLNLKAELRDWNTGRLRSREVNFNITQSSHSSDIFNVDFGMNKADVKSREIKRFEGESGTRPNWTETSPNVGHIYSQVRNQLISGTTKYEFKDDKLIRVTEIIPETYIPESKQEWALKIKDRLRRLGAQSQIFSEDEYGMLIGSSESWVRNGIKIAYDRKEITGSGVYNVTLTFEKEN